MTAFRLTASVLALLAATPALAQKLAPTRAYGQDDPAYQTYQTPKYRAVPPTPLDKNYGLPTFGMPGAELPKQRTQEPRKVPGPPKLTTDAPPPGNDVPPAGADTLPADNDAPPDYTILTPQPAQPETPNFFSDTPPDFTLPPPQQPPPRDDAATDSRTAPTGYGTPTTYGNGEATGYTTGPAFTTRSPTENDEYSTDSARSSATETPLYSTSEGSTTGSDTMSPNETR